MMYLLLGLLAFFHLLPHNAHSTRCIKYPGKSNLLKIASKADTLFIGIPISKRKSSGGRQFVEFQVIEHFKGLHNVSREGKIELLNGRHHSYSREVNLGKKYLVYGRRFDLTYDIGGCGEFPAADNYSDQLRQLRAFFGTKNESTRAKILAENEEGFRQRRISACLRLSDKEKRQKCLFRQLQCGLIEDTTLNIRCRMLNLKNTWQITGLDSSIKLCDLDKTHYKEIKLSRRDECLMILAKAVYKEDKNGAERVCNSVSTDRLQNECKESLADIANKKGQNTK